MDEENKSEENKPMEENTQNKNMSPMIIGVVVAVLVIATGVFLFTRNSTTNSELSEIGGQNQVEEITPVESSPASESMDQETITQENISTIKIEGGGFYFRPNEIRVKKGEKVIVEFKNAGGMHDFVIDELNVKAKLTKTGETATVEFTPTKTGEFEFYCSVADHKQKGMKGILIVE